MERLINWLGAEWGARDYYLILVTMSSLFMAVSLIDQLINRKSRALDFSAFAVIFCILSIIAMMFFGNLSIAYVGAIFMTLLAVGVSIHIATDNAVYYIQFIDNNRLVYKKKNAMFCILYFVLILGSSYLVM